MKIRLAEQQDLQKLKMVYKGIIENMNRNQIGIWDDIYPCDFFEKDIKNRCLYILEECEQIVGAFALSDSHSGEKAVEWRNQKAKALYLDRFGVAVDHLKKGMGSFMLTGAKKIARSKGVDWLRLFVVEINQPAINLYTKNGFKKAEGVYEEKIDEDLILYEYGYEIEL
ncbi:MAG: GNAT family N-acetyltransferase [Lachnospiraceae bacterium]|nr:GNAT family N-acetyltransferase [Lachnospiraceae bacterium]